MKLMLYIADQMKRKPRNLDEWNEKGTAQQLTHCERRARKVWENTDRPPVPFSVLTAV